MWSRLMLSDGNQWASVGECSSRPHVVTLLCGASSSLPDSDMLAHTRAPGSGLPD